jgi:tRNA threonylcarbamoyladenosine biosynthesis protein TsaB
MILYINTTENSFIEVALKNGDEVLILEKIAVDRTQAEKLLPAVESILKKKKLKLKNIKGIEVENRGGSFTSLRIGVATANALGFALGVPVVGADSSERQTLPPPPAPPRAGGGIFNVVEPKYSGEPDIR